ncbi:MAG TPA: hypothetical protein V6D30_19345 [Leptolyngbyaceae cyanobacterium]
MSEPNFSLLWQGLFIGLAIAAPVGPISSGGDKRPQSQILKGLDLASPRAK